MLSIFRKVSKMHKQRTITYIDYDDNEAIKTYTNDDIDINNFVVYRNITVLHDTKIDGEITYKYIELTKDGKTTIEKIDIDALRSFIESGYDTNYDSVKVYEKWEVEQKKNEDCGLKS